MINLEPQKLIVLANEKLLSQSEKESHEIITYPKTPLMVQVEHARVLEISSRGSELRHCSRRKNEKEGRRNCLKHFIRELPPAFWGSRVSNNPERTFALSIGLGLILRKPLTLWAALHILVSAHLDLGCVKFRHPSCCS